MASFSKEPNGKWRVQYRFVNWQGQNCASSKRGFSTKREAKEWFDNFALEKSDDLNMPFNSLVDAYFEDMAHRLKLNTIMTKRQIVTTKILPYFKDKAVCDISAVDIRKWQAVMIAEGNSETYLRTINNQLSTIFNYAVRFYDLKVNPCTKAGSIGSKNAVSKDFWTVEEFKTFADGLYDNWDAYIGFNLLFWTGMRIGELLALNAKDFDLKAKTVSISKSYQRIKGKDVITKPKTLNSTRIVSLPNFLIEDLEDYFSHIYEVNDRERLFPYTKHYFNYEMQQVCKRTGVKKIRLHDLRHSHASLLVNMGLGAKLIADRLGHKRIETTLNTYSHLYKSSQDSVITTLEAINAKTES